MTYDPNKHLTQIKTKEGARDYLPVQQRLVWFRDVFPHGTVETEMVHFDPDRETQEVAFAWNSETRKSERVIKHANGFVMFRAVVKDGEGGIATGTKSEKAASFPDYIEKCESGAIGRALAALGFGTQFCADELDEAHRIVDSPVERPQEQQAASTTNKPAASAPRQAQQQPAKPAMSGSMADEKQMQSIQALCKSLGRGFPTKLYKEAADRMQADLEKECQAQQQKAS